MKCPEAHSIASGLAPPFAGENTYNHVQKFVRGIILISEDEIKATVSTAFQRGLVVEPAGTAALAAVLTGKVYRKISIHCINAKNLYTLTCYVHIRLGPRWPSSWCTPSPSP